MTLRDYLSANKLTLDAFGALVGVSGVSVHRWVVGKARPSWPLLDRIAEVTNHAVTAADFMATPPAAAGEAAE
jgi:transcriptional regulator with XRE-family HTH domain